MKRMNVELYNRVTVTLKRIADELAQYENDTRAMILAGTIYTALAVANEGEDNIVKFAVYMQNWIDADGDVFPEMDMKRHGALLQ